jgi:EpsI family protein
MDPLAGRPDILTLDRHARARFLSAVALLAAATLFLWARSGAENVPVAPPLSSLPVNIGEWQGREQAIADDVREILGKGEFMARLYWNPSQRAYAELFVAYFASQRAGDTIHSPKNCLPGAGWSPVESGEITLSHPNGRVFPVNRYVIGKGLDRQVVLYWYQAHGRAVASEYWAKYYLVADAIRMNRTDGAMVRVVAPVLQHETIQDAQTRAESFARQILPDLDVVIPR